MYIYHLFSSFFQIQYFLLCSCLSINNIFYNKSRCMRACLGRVGHASMMPILYQPMMKNKSRINLLYKYTEHTQQPPQQL